jgi:MFS family permease
MPNQPHKLLLPLLFIGVLMGAIDLAIIGPALPAIQGDFGMRENQLAMLMNAYVLCQLLGTPLLAKLSDRFGPRAIYIASIGMFAGGSLLIAAAGSPMMMYVGRALQGFGAGGIFPVATAVIATRIPDEQRGPALGILGMVFGMAFLVGPILGGLLLPFGWQWLFLINLPIAAVLIAGAIRLLPTDGSDGKQPFDRAGATLLAIGLTAFVLGLNELDTGDIVASLTSWPVGGALALSLLVAPLFWRIEKRAADPIIAPRFFASRQIVRACVLSAGRRSAVRQCIRPGAAGDCRRRRRIHRGVADDPRRDRLDADVPGDRQADQPRRLA